MRIATDARVAADAVWRLADAEERVAAPDALRVAAEVRETDPAEDLAEAPEAARVETPERVVPGERRLAPPETVPFAMCLSRDPHVLPAPA